MFILRKAPLFIFLLIFSDIVLSSVFQKCTGVLQELFKNPVKKEKLQEFMKLKGKLTLHKLTWSIYANDVNKPLLTLQEKILNAAEDIEKTSETDNEFRRIKKEFEKNSLSRKSLAHIIPKISSLLLAQTETIKDPYEREHFIINESDIKLLAVLGEQESTLASGKFNANFIKDNSHKDSILNFTKIINSSMRNKKITKKNIDEIEKKVKQLTKKIDSLIQSLDIPDQCKEIISKQCRGRKSQESFNDIFLSFVTDFIDFDYLNNLKYEKVWLHYADYSKKENKKRKVNKKNQVKMLSRFERLDSPVRKKISHPSLSPELKNYFSQKVIERYGYFFNRDWLGKNEEFTSELAKSIDEKRDWIAYKGEKYFIPDIYNHANYRAQGFSFRDLQKDAQKILNSDDKTNRRMCSFTKRSRPSIYYTLKGIKKHSKKTNRSIRSFRYDKQLCDAKTAQLISRDIKGFLRFPAHTKIEEKKNWIPSAQRTKIAHKALKEHKEYYPFKEKIYHISGAEAIVSSSIKYPEKSNGELPPSVALAVLEKSDYAIVNDKLFSLEKGRFLDQAERDYKLILSLKSHSSPEQAQSTLNKTSPELRNTWLKSLSDGRFKFTHKNKDYSNLDARAYTPLRSVKLQSKKFINEDEYYEEINNINKLPNHKLIKFYQKNLSKNKCAHYTVIDKNQKKLFVYSNDGDEIFQKEILIGRNLGDERTSWVNYNPDENLRKSNKKSGAGIYTTESLIPPNERAPDGNDGYYKMYEGNILGLNQHNPLYKGTVIALHQVPLGYEYRYALFNNGNLNDNSETGGCINLKRSDMVEYAEKFYHSNKKTPQKSCDFYILPDEDKHHFQIKNQKLVFEPRNKDICYSNNKDEDPCHKWTNYSIPHGKEFSKDIKIRYDIKKMKTAFPKWSKLNRRGRSIKVKKIKKNLNQFTSSLQINKNLLMRKTGLSNLEYNQLSKVALGVYGVESLFGTSLKFQLKEALPFFVQKVKAYSNDSTSNSQGATQIKNVNSYYKQYNLPEINPKKLKDDTKETAKATMLVLADMLYQLKKYQTKNELVDFSTPQRSRNTINSLIYYIYQGKRTLLDASLATPKLNPQVSRIQTISHSIDIYTEI